MWEILLVQIENLEIVVELNHGHGGVALYWGLQQQVRPETTEDDVAMDAYTNKR